MNKKLRINKNTSLRNAFKDQLGLLMGLFALCLLLSIISPVFLSTRNLFNVLRQMSINMFLSCGMLLVILVGGIDLSVGSIIAVSGCLVAGFITNLGMNPILALVLATLLGIGLGAISALIISSTNIPSFIITLAMMNVGRGIARIYTSSKTITIDNSLFATLGTAYIGAIPIQVIYIVLVSIITWIILNKTVIGRNIYATGGNPIAAKFSGINTKRTVFFVFIYSAILSSFAGIITASRMFAGTSTAGQSAEMDAIAAVVLGGASMSGGTGNVFGTVIGVILIAVLSNGLNLVGVDSSWQYVAKGIVIIIAVVIDYLRKGKNK
ncbi:MAG: ABC transporter permease [Sphaerochaetaceae bacterium]|nr:ABC transporter permease [Sphaerochaetaceae bacterium]